ncbi:hypothetical protein quinque_009054 [Culex quinquefasciatus]
MSQVRTRENTFKVDLSNFPKRPSIEELQKFVLVNLGLAVGQVKRFQVNHAQNCAHVKCVDLKTAQDAVAKHDGKHEMDVNKTKVKVRLVMEDGGVEVKIHDLSENVTSEEIVAFLRNYGDVLNIREVPWERADLNARLDKNRGSTSTSYASVLNTSASATNTLLPAFSSTILGTVMPQRPPPTVLESTAPNGSLSQATTNVAGQPAAGSTIISENTAQSVHTDEQMDVAELSVGFQTSGGSSSSNAQNILTSVTELSAESAAAASGGGAIVCPKESERSSEPTVDASEKPVLLSKIWKLRTQLLLKVPRNSALNTCTSYCNRTMRTQKCRPCRTPHAQPCSDHYILGGDFNCVTSSKDSKGNSNNSLALKNLIDNLALKDAWEVLKGNRTVFSFIRPNCASRLDRLYISESLVTSLRTAEYLVTSFSDHKAFKQLYSTGSVEPNTNFPSNRSVDAASEANIRSMDEITTEEIFTAIKTSASRKSPGPDGIPKEFYEKAFDIIYRQLNLILNEALQGQFPDQFLEGVVVLSKKNSNLKTIKGYRPITLLNYDYKLLSRVLKVRLERIMQENGLLNSSQNQLENPPNLSGIPAMYPCLKAIARELAYVPHSLATNPTATELHDFYRKTLSKPKVMAERSATSWRLVWHNIRCKRFTSAERSTYYLLVNHKISHAALLFRQNRQDSEMCQHCPNVVEDLKHKFTNCSRVKHLWEYLQPKLEAILDRRVSTPAHSSDPVTPATLHPLHSPTSLALRQLRTLCTLTLHPCILGSLHPCISCTPASLATLAPRDL